MTESPSSSERPYVRVRCFEAPEQVSAFEESFTKLMRDRQKEATKLFMSDENVLRYTHGRQWVRPAHEENPETTIHTLSSGFEIRFQDLVDNDLGMIEKALVPLSQDMVSQFMQMMYGTVSAAAEKVGNVVDVKGSASMAEAMLEMWRKIELGVGRDGQVSTPQIHMHPDSHAKLMEALANQPPEFEEELRRLQAEKREAALAREAERKARFRKQAE